MPYIRTATGQIINAEHVHRFEIIAHGPTTQAVCAVRERHPEYIDERTPILILDTQDEARTALGLLWEDLKLGRFHDAMNPTETPAAKLRAELIAAMNRHPDTDTGQSIAELLEEYRTDVIAEERDARADRAADCGFGA